MLFRKEALEARNKTWSGKAVLLSGLPGRYIVSFTFVFFIIFVVLVVECSYTRRVNVNGEITSVPRAITVFSSHQGFVTTCLVTQGQKVKKGQALYFIDVSRTTTSGVVNKRHRESILKRIDTLSHIDVEIRHNRSITISMLKEEKERYELALKHSSDAVARAREGLRLMKENMDNYRQYQKKGLINRDQLISQTALYYQQQNDILGLDTQNEQNALQVLTLQSTMQTQASDFDNQLHQISIQKSALEGELADADADGDQVITSPVDGIVDTLSVSPGQAVSTGDSLIQIIPDTAHYRQLVLWVPDSAVLYLSIGQRVNIRYDAFPSEKFGQFPGKIFLIAHTPASWQEMATYPNAPLRSPEGPQAWYKVIVTPDTERFLYKNKTIIAENGMKATVTLFLDERQLYQWILAPFYDVRDSAAGLVHE
ncbi:HlyD family secretion protein [Pantoea piersonii]|uniref:HlyD family secretion protein n=1 Tax=Pantoea piersonii TaxID=2364647 RepID=A0AAJ5UC61_9GAMM|nr:HlyD family secretion protein [Pantoea piersonii]WBG93128.1 HlyD family secretion protein [Pantoea piersonii]